MQAYVLSKAHTGDIQSALGILRRTRGVISAKAVFEPYDIALEAEGLGELGNLVPHQITDIPYPSLYRIAP